MSAATEKIRTFLKSWKPTLAQCEQFFLEFNCFKFNKHKRIFFVFCPPSASFWLISQIYLWYIPTLHMSHGPSAPLLPPLCGSDPSVDAARPVQQPPSVPGTSDGLNEKQEPKPSEQPTEHCRGYNHERRHHHKAQDDEGGAAVVVKVTTDGRWGIKNLQGQTQRESISREKSWGTVCLQLHICEKQRDEFAIQGVWFKIWRQMCAQAAKGRCHRVISFDKTGSELSVNPWDTIHLWKVSRGKRWTQEGQWESK